MPGLDAYLLQRLGPAGGPPTLALLETANGQEIPTREMDAPVVRAMTELAWAVASVDNDLHSYQCETGQVYTDQNAINVCAHQEVLDRTGAHPRGRAAGPDDAAAAGAARGRAAARARRWSATGTVCFTRSAATPTGR